MPTRVSSTPARSCTSATGYCATTSYWGPGCMSAAQCNISPVPVSVTNYQPAPSLPRIMNARVTASSNSTCWSMAIGPCRSPASSTLPFTAPGKSLLPKLALSGEGFLQQIQGRDRERAHVVDPVTVAGFDGDRPLAAGPDDG